MKTSCAVTIISLGTAVFSAHAGNQYPIEDFLDTITITGGSFSPDGTKLLVSTDQSGIFNAFALPVDGSAPVQLTESTTDSIFAVSYFPDDERFIYQADQGGNELTHVYIRELNGTVKDLTPGDSLKAMFLHWAEDEKSFFLSTNERDPKFFDLYEVGAASYERTMVYENIAGYFVFGVSPDRRYVALKEVHTTRDGDVFVHDRETDKTIMILGHPDSIVNNTPQFFDKETMVLLCSTDLDHEFRYLAAAPLEAGDPDTISKEDWDIQYAQLSPAGGYWAEGLNVDGVSQARVRDIQSGDTIPVPPGDGAGVARVIFNADDTAIAYYTQGARTPGDLYYWKLDASAAPVRLTNRLSTKIDAADLVEPEVVRFTSYDGLEIPGILYQPHGATADNPAPALVYVHGGPGGQTTVSYTPLIQFLVNHGYAVYGINNRGSSGYGKTFFSLDDHRHGNADLDDCVASKQMLIDTGWVDPDRIAIIGGSYGGYMVCAAMAFRPEAFAAGVNIFGVTNWVRTLKSIPPWWTAQRDALYEELGDPFEEEDYPSSISPLFHAENIRRPMIVLQGANDPRVLQVESDEMVAAIRDNDIPVEYVVFPDEGHGFRKKANQITGYQAILEFLDEQLGEGE